MPNSIQNVGIVGLGKMGAGMAQNALRIGLKVAGVDTHPVSDELKHDGIQVAVDLKALAAALPAPRFVMLYVPAGPPVDGVIEQLAAVLQAGDIIADGGNSYWGDSIRRHARLKERGIHFVDCGTSADLRSALCKDHPALGIEQDVGDLVD
jgi:6-phosphogluconate dehydrogenase